MQRKALKQLNKVTQWTSEKVFSGEKTQYSDEFAEFEAQVEPLRVGFERLHATSVPFVAQLVKVQTSADPHPPPGASKDKLQAGEALGSVMADVGADAGGPYGHALVQYGQARARLAAVQTEYCERLEENYLSVSEASLGAVNEYKTFRRKMDSRRLTLDAALARQKTSKKDSATLEQEVEIAQQRFEEAEEETRLRMEAIRQQQEEQFDALRDFLDAELDFFTRSKDILDDLRETFPEAFRATSAVRTPTRPRAKSSASAKSVNRTPTRSRPSPSESDNEDKPPSGNRSRSDSTASASAGKPKGRGIMSSIGSFGVKSMSSASKTAKGRGSRTKYGNISEEQRLQAGLGPDDEGDEGDDLYDAPVTRTPPRPAAAIRTRSHSSASQLSLHDTVSSASAPRRRALTSPPSPTATFVKVLFDFAGHETDELSLKRGQIVEVRQTVSADWCIGEYDGQTGLFPRAYTEEYVPAASTALPAGLAAQAALAARPRPVAPPLDTRRSAPQILTSRMHAPSPHDDELETESEHELYETEDRTSLAATAQPPPTVAAAPPMRSRSSSIKKPAPPPPPSRRSTGLVSPTAPPPVAFNRSRSSTLSRSTPLHSNSEEESPFAGGSPFAHSDDEYEGLQPLDRRAAASRFRASPSAGSDSSRDLGCAVCGCDSFTQNVFKPSGTCSSCFHQH